MKEEQQGIWSSPDYDQLEPETFLMSGGPRSAKSGRSRS